MKDFRRSLKVKCFRGSYGRHQFKKKAMMNTWVALVEHLRPMSWDKSSIRVGAARLVKLIDRATHLISSYREALVAVCTKQRMPLKTR